MKRSRIYSPYAVEAARLLGAQISLARRERRWSMRELAERVGTTEFTLGKVERGDPTVSLGVAFEAATLVRVPLFNEDPSRTTLDIDRVRARIALLPHRIRARKEDVRDDF